MTGHAALCVAALVAAADADTPEPRVTTEAPRDALEWRPEWRRFDWGDGAATLALGATAIGFRSAPLDTQPNVTSGFLMDDPIRDAVGLEDPNAFLAWKAAGDWPYRVAMGWSMVDVVTAGAVHGNWDTAMEMMLIDLEAFAISGAVIWTSQFFVRRERPLTRHCDAGIPIADELSCDEPGSNRSFIGGHTALTTTAAALTCLHHEKLPLWGGGLADDAVCATWIAAAGTVFVSRTVTEKHYFTDNLLGATLGVFAGYVVPKALHYGFGTPDGDEDDAEEIAFDGTPRLLGPSFAPTANGEGFSIGLVGAM